MDLDSLGSCDSGPTVANGFDSVESLLAYTVDKRQRNAEAASPELRKEALLSNTVKRAHRLLSVPNETYYSADFEDDEDIDHNYEETDIDVTNEKDKHIDEESEKDESNPDQEINQNNKRKREDNENLKPSLAKKIRSSSGETEEQMNNLSLSNN